MSRTTQKWVGTFALFGLLIVGVITLAACGGQPAAQPPAATQAPTAAPPTNTAIPPTQTPAPSPTLAPTDTPAPSPTLAPTDTPAPEPTATATEAPAAAPVSLDSTNCVTCHTNEETLQKLAKEEDPAESLSEGEG